MSDGMAVYVGVRGATVPDGSTALDAVRAIDPAEADEVASGSCLICDSRGLPIPPDTPAYSGAIFRIVRSRSTSSVDENTGVAELSLAESSDESGGDKSGVDG
jgi:hypothetical protein